MEIFSIVKQQISIFDVVQEYTSLKRAGNYFKGCCPFHQEKTASFTISPDKNIFYCFGCHASGDVIGFISKVEGCGQLEAAQLLADKYNIAIPEEYVRIKTSEVKDLYYKAHSVLKDWAKKQLLHNPGAKQYLANRKISAESISRYSIGFFPSGQRAISNLLEVMRNENILAADLIQMNIIRQGKAVLYSPFEDRILFPITDHIGRICGFGGRIFKPSDERVKYYNSQETDFFTKGSLLYGLEQAKKEIQKTKKVFLVEGYTDCIAMAHHGYQNTVATLGTACTSVHLKQLARYADKLYFVYDGDAAGTQALLRVAQLCWQENIEPYVIQLPEKDDPETYLVRETSLETLLRSSCDIFSFFIRISGKDFTTQSLSSKLKTIQSCMHMIEKIKDPIKQSLLLQKASAAFNIPIESLQKEIKREEKSSSIIEKKDLFLKASDKTNSVEISAIERHFFYIILNNLSLAKRDDIKLLFPYFPKPISDIFLSILELLQTKNISDTQELLLWLPEDQKQITCKILLEFINEPNDTSSTTYLIAQVQKKIWKKIAHDIKLKLAYAKQKQDVKKISQLMNQLIQIQKTLLLLTPRQDEN